MKKILYGWGENEIDELGKGRRENLESYKKQKIFFLLI
jgi:hypothetical protein